VTVTVTVRAPTTVPATCLVTVVVCTLVTLRVEDTVVDRNLTKVEIREIMIVDAELAVLIRKTVVVVGGGVSLIVVRANCVKVVVIVWLSCCVFVLLSVWLSVWL
jgi:hypothetical protein